MTTLYSYPSISKSDAAIKAREIMQRKIDSGIASATATLEHVFSAAPIDSIVTGRALTFEPKTDGVSVAWKGSEALTIHRHALGQMAQRSGVPGQYLNEMSTAKEDWKRALAADILTRHFHQGEPSRNLVRSVGGSVKGFLSDRYRRLDSRPLIEAFATSCQAIGAVPVEGTVTDLRVTMKALLPMVFEPVPGEVMCLGLEWGNSDFGAAKHSMRAFILRLWCLNGATMEDALSQVHLGGRLNDDIEYSARTYEYDTRASVSALRDTTTALLGPKKVDMLLETIKAADEKKIDWKHATSSIGKKLLKGEMKLVEDAFKSEDVINLPAKQSVWRVSNAISWIAGKTEDADRKLELQRLAGEVLNGKSDAA